MIGTIISHYTIVEEIGQGGMGVIYKAHDSRLDRDVALKFILPEHIRSEELKTRFIREARAAASLSHTNIATVHDIEEADGKLFIVMEYVEGRDLASHLESGPMKPDDAVALFTQMTEGVHAAHAKGIVHRDIKCQNILITPDGIPKVVDFGLSKMSGASMLTKDHTTVGTMAYMSPEQVRGEEADRRTDIWALGVVFYEMLTGSRPFQAHYEEALMYQVLNEDPRPVSDLRPDVPHHVSELVREMLAKDKGFRVADLDAVRARLRAAEESGDGQTPRKKGARKLLPVRPVALGAFLLLVIAAVLVVIPWGSPRSITSIAVLPLADISSSPEGVIFADGMTDALIGRFSRIGALKVISRTSVMRFKGTQQPLPEIAGELDVDAVIEGTVVREGERIRVRASLVTEAEEHLWSNEYERDLSDILRLQSEIALAVVDEIRLALSVEEHAIVGTSRKIDPEAHTLYLKALQLYRANASSPKVQEEALALIDRSLRIDSTDVDALLLRTSIVFTRTGTGYEPAAPILEQVDRNVRKILELDPNVGEAYAMRAQVRLMNSWDWEEAERDLLTAIHLEPNSPLVLNYHSWFLANLGRFDESIALSQRALELDPLAPLMGGQLVHAYFNARRFDAAIAEAHTLLQIFPDDAFIEFWLGRAYGEIGQYDKAVETFLGRKVRSPGTSWALGVVYGKMGETAKAREIIRFLEERARTTFIWPTIIAAIYASIGEKEQAMDLVEESYRAREYFITRIRIDPLFDPLRDEPRFRQIMEEIRFPKTTEDDDA